MIQYWGDHWGDHWGEIASWGVGKMQDCPVQHPELFAMESNPVAGMYGHGQAEWLGRSADQWRGRGGEIASWGPCRGWGKLQDCPVQHPELFAMESNPVAGIYGHGQTEWYRTYAAAKARLRTVPLEARWHGQRYGCQGDEPIRLSPVGETLWKLVFKYSPTYWLEVK